MKLLKEESIPKRNLKQSANKVTSSHLKKVGSNTKLKNTTRITLKKSIHTTQDMNLNGEVIFHRC